MAEPVIVVGAGALGCLFAAQLAAAGSPVFVLDQWEEGLAALRAQGVTLLDGSLPPRSFPVHAASSPSECAGIRRALVLVKGWQTAWAADQLERCLPADGIALTLQNGLGNLETLAARLGPRRTAAGSTTWGAALEAPGIVRLNGRGDLIISAVPAADPLAGTLAQAGFIVERSSEIELILWRKLVVNAAINPLSAVLKVPNGQLVASSPARALLRRLAEEAARVGSAAGFPLDIGEMVSLVEKVARQTAANHSSMLQDMRRGAPTEIDTITGAVIRTGAQTGTPTPFSEAIYHLVKAVLEVRSQAGTGKLENPTGQ